MYVIQIAVLNSRGLPAAYISSQADGEEIQQQRILIKVRTTVYKDNLIAPVIISSHVKMHGDDFNCYAGYYRSQIIAI